VTTNHRALSWQLAGKSRSTTNTRDWQHTAASGWRSVIPGQAPPQHLRAFGHQPVTAVNMLGGPLTLLIEILPSPSLLRPPPAASLLGQIRRVFSLVVRCGRGPRDAPARSEFQSVVLIAYGHLSASPHRMPVWPTTPSPTPLYPSDGARTMCATWRRWIKAS
jgi:hypothetical protein